MNICMYYMHLIYLYRLSFLEIHIILLKFYQLREIDKKMLTFHNFWVRQATLGGKGGGILKSYTKMEKSEQRVFIDSL